MRKYIIRRVLYAIPTLLGISVIVFLVSRLSPGDPVRLYTFGATNITEADIAALRHFYGLDQPLPKQYVDWLMNMVRGDFGKSLQYNQPAFALLMERLPATLQLAVLALVLQIGIGVPLGVIAALNRGRWVDNAVRFFGVIGHAIPTFWIGLLFIVLFAVNLHWLPSQGLLTIGKDVWDIPDRLRHILLPALVLALAGVANYSRYLRTETLDVIAQDYVRTARAKGLAEPVVVLKHALRNALTPIITLGALELGTLLSGAVLTEQIFSIPGFGKLIVDAVFNRDYAVVQGVVLTTATIYITLNLIADIAYVLVNPRLRT
jgi:peptide/nickel transport system permease protein